MLWEQHLRELAAFKKKFGQWQVSTLSTEYRVLGNWVRTQRGLRRRGILAEDRVKRLDRLGFLWDRPPRTFTERQRVLIGRAVKRTCKTRWEAWYLALAEYREQHGHCRVRASGKYTPLAKWVAWQRVSRTRRKLSRNRIQRLDALGFVWTATEERWEQMVDALARYKQVHGDCNVPGRWSENQSLASWVQLQRNLGRNGRLPPHRKRQLEALGFVWSVTELRWGLMFEMLVEYKKAHGDCNVPKDWAENLALARWVHNQRGYNWSGRLRPQHKGVPGTSSITLRNYI